MMTVSVCISGEAERDKVAECLSVMVCSKVSISCYEADYTTIGTIPVFKTKSPL